MDCPICKGESFVLKTMGARRRRKCARCKHRFTTEERLAEELQRQEEAMQAVREAAEKLKAA